MRWAGWLSLLIPLVLVILSSIFRASQEKPQRRVRVIPTDDDDRNRQRVPADTDEFLREARRRRAATDSQRRRQSRPVQEQEPILTVLPVREDIASPAQVVHEQPVPIAVPVSTPSVKPATVRQPVMSPALVQLAGLLRSRQNLRAAVMLREILDPPLCHRR